MKKPGRASHIRAFLGGMASALVIVVLTTTAMAASGQLKFNTANICFDHVCVFPKDKYLKTETGGTIPSSILYTDEQGAGTTYVPIRVLTQALHMPTFWDGKSSFLNVSVSGEQALYFLPHDQIGQVWTGLAEEIEPVVPTKGKVLFHEDWNSKDAFEKEFYLPKAADGSCVNITITNRGNYPVSFGLGFSSDGYTLLTPTQVPAGETVTRALNFLSFDNLKDTPISLVIDSGNNVSRMMDISVEAVQFKGV